MSTIRNSHGKRETGDGRGDTSDLTRDTSVHRAGTYLRGEGDGVRPPPLAVVGPPRAAGPRGPTIAFAPRGYGSREPTSSES